MDRTNEKDQHIALAVERLTVAYDKTPVLVDVSFSIPEGKIVGIIGPNGAGKSTLIQSILGLVPRTSGNVEIYGQPLQRQRKLVGYVPQRESVDWDFPISALDVVLMGRYGYLRIGQRPRKEDKQYALACLERVGMVDYAHRQIGQLSGGQQQRVFLARALAQDAMMYFMDEPLVGVDATTERSIMSLLKTMREQRKTVFVVHHDLATVSEYFDWTILLNRGVIAYGPTEDVFHPENLRKTYGGQLTIFHIERKAENVTTGSSIGGEH